VCRQLCVRCRKPGSEDDVAKKFRENPGDPAANCVAAGYRDGTTVFHTGGNLSLKPCCRITALTAILLCTISRLGRQGNYPQTLSLALVGEFFHMNGPVGVIPAYLCLFSERRRLLCFFANLKNKNEKWKL